MVDRALFTDMNGAKQSLSAMRLIANNLANTKTIGFKADYLMLKNIQSNQKSHTRVSPSLEKSYSDFREGALINTDNELDIAIDGQGFIAVQNAKGQEAYTRAGNLELKNGLLTTAKGDIVLGDGGVITIPPVEKISIDSTGTISARLMGQQEKDITVIGRIKLVQPALDSIHKGEDGLFYATNGNVEVSPDVKVKPGYLESSNVEPIRALTDLIDISRNFEIHTKLMKTVEDNSYKANQLLETGS